LINELTKDWPAAIQLEVSAYIERHHLDPQVMLRVDLVLILCRLDGVDARKALAELTGRAITRCPSGMPAPYAAPAQKKRGSMVVKVHAPNPCTGVAMRGRYEIVKVGMTRDQLLRRGVTKRDLRYWTDLGYIEITKEEEAA
jgi:hypothetical protein